MLSIKYPEPYKSVPYVFYYLFRDRKRIRRSKSRNCQPLQVFPVVLLLLLLGRAEVALFALTPRPVKRTILTAVSSCIKCIVSSFINGIFCKFSRGLLTVFTSHRLMCSWSQALPVIKFSKTVLSS